MVPFLIIQNQMLIGIQIISLISFVIALLFWINERAEHDITKRILDRTLKEKEKILESRKLWEKAYHAKR